MFWGSGGTEVSSAGIVCLCDWFPLKVWTPSLRNRGAFLVEHTMHMFSHICYRNYEHPIQLHWEKKFWKLESGFLQTLPHELLPFADSVLYHFVVITHNHENKNFCIQWMILVNQQVWGWLGNPVTIWYFPLRHQKGRCIWREIKQQKLDYSHICLNLSFPPKLHLWTMGTVLLSRKEEWILDHQSVVFLPTNINFCPIYG